MNQRSIAIVSVAFKGRENYSTGIPRLIASARACGFDGDFLICAPELGPELAPGVPNMTDLALPSHRDVPYGFKPVIVAAARERGFRRVLWCDSTIFFLRDAPEMFRWQIGSSGMFLFDNPNCPEGRWTSDDCLAAMDCSPEETQKINQVMACSAGFDFGYPVANNILDDWLAYSRDGTSFQGRSGSTRPEFVAHRHDQSVLSCLAYRNRVPLVPYGLGLTYWDDRLKFNPYICNRGLTAA